MPCTWQEILQPTAMVVHCSAASATPAGRLLLLLEDSHVRIAAVSLTCGCVELGGAKPVIQIHSPHQWYGFFDSSSLACCVL